MFGPLVVHQARTADPNSDLYGHDLPEHLIMVSYFALYSLGDIHRSYYFGKFGNMPFSFIKMIDNG